MSLEDWSYTIGIVGGIANAITAWAAITLVFLKPKKELTCYIGKFSETTYNSNPQSNPNDYGYHKYVKVKIENTGWPLTKSDFWDNDMARLCFIQNYEYAVVEVSYGTVTSISSQNPSLLSTKVYRALSSADWWAYTYLILGALRLEKNEAFEIELRCRCHSKEELDKLTSFRIINQLSSGIRVKIKSL